MNKNKDEYILEISNLKKYFVNGSIVNKAVDNVSFNVKKGEIVGLIGESGSGKTTVGRSLLRLYDDFSGFVTLHNQIISGKRISRKRSKFMHKNIQMIFQDPMASLNGQNNIYTILKEPLVVNGIIKNKIKDISSDWTKIADNFHYTFLEESLKLELENIRVANRLLKPFVSKWQNVKLADFSASENTDDQFNAYFGFLEERGKINSLIVNSFYKNIEQLIALYDNKQKDFRNNNIDFDEVELEQARNEYQKQKKLRFKTELYYENKDLFIERFKDFNNVRTQNKDFKNVTKNALRNFIQEFRNEANIHKNEAYSSSSIPYFFHQYKLYKLNLFVKKAIKSNLSKLQFLNLEELKSLVADLQNYINHFYKDELIVDETKKASIKEIDNIINNNFKFDWNSYISKSQETREIQRNAYNENKNLMLESFSKVFKEFFKLPKQNKQALTEARQKLEQTQKIFDSELEKYISEYIKRIENYKKDIEEEKRIQKEYLKSEKEEMYKFLNIHNEFNVFYKTNLIAPIKVKYKEILNKRKLFDSKIDYTKAKNKLKEELKQREIELKVYNTTVAEKIENNKSFEIELRYLNKDISNIMLLLGISLFDLKFYNTKFKSLFRTLISKYRKYKLAQLFTKNAIYKALEDVGLLKQFAYRYPHEFSGGQRQRIVIARALITEPSVIVADEPIASLDISIQAQVVNLLKDLCKEKNIGMIFIAHDLSMIEYVADRVQIMHLGKIVESGDTNKIYSKPVHPYTNNLFKAIPKISNANEKFKDVTFELSYLQEQQFPNIPLVKEIEPEHFVYGTEEQIEKWTKDEHFKASALK
ncbi:ATP-binding cassette domain-containing protein [Mycoplasmopsis gallinacea]|uniref:Phosphate ABC transporter ATP-binding protein n=1 Tax=Mycoplasmopsis gallinacea TaxID=29556 RepID=A0A449A2V7_9BACT|nr:ATP-binding cassette domain-containing protein [Mycoplasmopsis gallinacea]VEU58579.1 phosphate ABC transporter ATP-binding protein [Mycoplasmopsis gallinacea]